MATTDPTRTLAQYGRARLARLGRDIAWSIETAPHRIREHYFRPTRRTTSPVFTAMLAAFFLCWVPAAVTGAVGTPGAISTTLALASLPVLLVGLLAHVTLWVAGRYVRFRRWAAAHLTLQRPIKIE